jgi:hypothetical protein
MIFLAFASAPAMVCSRVFIYPLGSLIGEPIIMPFWGLGEPRYSYSRAWYGRSHKPAGLSRRIHCGFIKSDPHGSIKLKGLSGADTIVHVRHKSSPGDIPSKRDTHFAQ